MSTATQKPKQGKGRPKLAIRKQPIRLTLEMEVIKKAKSLAWHNNESVSQLVNRLLSNI